MSAATCTLSTCMFISPAVFAAQVRRHLHVVLCFSPVGEAFRERLRKFPSLITCTTINWCVRASVLCHVCPRRYCVLGVL